jgi:hypothetical protein
VFEEYYGELYAVIDLDSRFNKQRLLVFKGREIVFSANDYVFYRKDRLIKVWNAYKIKFIPPCVFICGTPHVEIDKNGNYL